MIRSVRYVPTCSGAFPFRLAIYFPNLLYAQKAVYAIRFALPATRPNGRRLGSVNADNDCSLEHSRQITAPCFRQLYCNVISFPRAHCAHCARGPNKTYARSETGHDQSRRETVTPVCLFPRELAFP